jgi:transcriptional regulator with XRE-family HTH domain
MAISINRILSGIIWYDIIVLEVYSMYNKYDIADRIYIARTKKRLKQQDVCKVLGIGQPSYSALETGKRTLNVEELFKLSELLGVSVEWILGTDGNNNFTNEERLEIEKFKRYIKSIREM